MKLNFGINYSLNIEDYDSEGIRIFITGQSGSGKSYLAKVILEELAENGIPIIVIDPEGEYYPFKFKYPTLVVGGRFKDLSFESLTVPFEQIIKLIYQGEFRILIFDTSQSSTTEQLNLHTDILESVFRVSSEIFEDMFIIVEEAHLIAPERKKSESLSIAVEIAKRGRKRGLNSIWITQRPSDISKQVISQCNIRFFGRLQDPADLKAIKPFIRGQIVSEKQLMTLKNSFILFDRGIERLIKARPLKFPELNSKVNIWDLNLIDAYSDIKSRIVNKLTAPKQTFSISLIKEETDKILEFNHPLFQEAKTIKDCEEYKEYLMVLFNGLKPQLLLKSRLNEIKAEKKRLLNTLENIGKLLETDNVSLNQIENKIKKYKSEIKAIKQQEKQLLKKNPLLPHEELFNQKKKIREQMKKIDIMLEKGKIQESIYHQLRGELQEKLKKINNYLKNAKSNILDIIIFIKNEINNLKKEIELTHARFEVGQVNEEIYHVRIKDLKLKLNEFEKCLNVLKKDNVLFQNVISEVVDSNG
ncbi:MAG: helicase HerA domain-containing protein [Candidatus Odinarchaeia archaeon]